MTRSNLLKTLREATRGRPRKTVLLPGQEPPTPANVQYQLRKSISLRGNYAVEFADGSKFKVDPITARKVMNMIDDTRLPAKKQELVLQLSASAKEFKKMAGLSVKEDVSEGLRMSPEAGKKLAASVASKAKGKIIPHHSQTAYADHTEHRFGYTDASGERHDTKIVKRPRPFKLSQHAINFELDKIRKKHSVNEDVQAADFKLVKVKLPDGRMVWRKVRAKLKVQ